MTKIKTIIGKNLPIKLFNFINKARISEYGKKANLFKKKNHKDTLFFFVFDNKEIVSLGMLWNIKINYENRDYNLKGIGGILSLQKGKGYGKILIQSMIKYLKKTGKTGLGFCGTENSKFYEKAGLKTKKDFNERFVMKNPKTGELIKDPDKDCDGIYYEGKDKFIKKVLSTKALGYYWRPEIKIPHW